MSKDKKSSLSSVKQYMYIPAPIEYYQHINNKINEYYESMNMDYKNDKFINYIYENELEEHPLSDELGKNIKSDDCLLLDFDTNFPIVNGVDKNEFLFHFLRNCYELF